MEGKEIYCKSSGNEVGVATGGIRWLDGAGLLAPGNS